MESIGGAEVAKEKTINYYRVEIRDGKGILERKSEFKKEALNILGENNRYIVVEDWCFTSIKKTKDSYDTCIDKPSIGIHSGDTVWGSRITYALYTYGNKRASTIKKEIEAEINKRYGFFMNGLDLSIIKD